MGSQTKAKASTPAGTKSSAGLQKILRLRGIHWLVTRFGGKILRSLSFDEKFRSGDWDFSQESPELIHVVEKYCAGGHILMLGCGSAPIAGSLAPDSYQSFLGVDISQEGIALASRQATENIYFVLGDMAKHRCSRDYDVVLFSESIYYVPFFKRRRLLKEICRHLTHRGRIIVTIAQPDRYAGTLRMIRRNFMVDVDRALEGAARWLLVFRANIARST